jgi:hypothetical protein
MNTLHKLPNGNHLILANVTRVTTRLAFPERKIKDRVIIHFSGAIQLDNETVEFNNPEDARAFHENIVLLVNAAIQANEMAKLQQFFPQSAKQ